MSKSKKRAYETSSEDSVLASKGSAAAIKRKKVPSQKFLPACHKADPWLGLSRKGSELVLRHLQIGQGVQGDWKVFFQLQADWQTDLYNCTLILSQAVGLTIFPHSHVHGPARALNGSTPLVCGWDLGSSAMQSPYVYDLHFQALWSSDSENYIGSVKLIETLRERECLVCVCVLDKLIILSKFVTEIKRICYTYTTAK